MTYSAAMTGSERKLLRIMNSNNSLSGFLLCSPYSTNPIISYGGALEGDNADVFNEKLYVAGNDDGIEDGAMKSIISGAKSTIKIIGNKGCGKTTLVHELEKRIESRGIRTLLLDFGDSNSTLKYRKATDIVVKTIYQLLKDDLSGNNAACIVWLLDLYEKIENDIDTDWDANNRIDDFFTCLHEVINCNSADKRTKLKREIRPIMFEMELFQLILLFILCDTFRNIADHTKTVVFIDNLDNMYDIRDIKLVLMNYDNFLSGIGKIMNVVGRSLNIKVQYNYCFLFALRDSTNAYLSHHELAIKQIAYAEYDATKHYDKVRIANTRLQTYIDIFSKETTSDTDVQVHNAKLLDSILQDPYVAQTIFDVFNNDYRICLLEILKIVESGKLNEEYYDCIRKNRFWNGSRGVIYRLIFNTFKSNGYFDKLKIVDFKNRGVKVSSPSRLILTYIANLTDERHTSDGRSVSFADLIDDIGSKIEDSEVARCIWEMYNLITAEDWCNLILFAETENASEEDLASELASYRENQRSKKPISKNTVATRLKITTAGLAFLTYVATHFEYFSCRLFGERMPPLFYKSSLGLKDEEYVYKAIINAVLKEVQICAQKLLDHSESENGLCNSDNSDFVFRRAERSAQYHGERLIFSHIRYLDEYRRFVLLTEEADVSHNVAEYTIDIISKYISIITENKTRCSRRGKTVIIPELEALLSKAKNDPYNPAIVIGRDS